MSNYTDQEIIEKAKNAGWTWKLINEEWGEWQSDGTMSIRTPIDKKTSCLRARNGTLGFEHDYICHECKKPLWLRHISNVNQRLMEKRECSVCNFWLVVIKSGNAIVAESKDGVRIAYALGPKKKPGPYNGFAGHWFRIEKMDGEVIFTCDLWQKGKIPKRFHNRLPVNAHIDFATVDMLPENQK